MIKFQHEFSNQEEYREHRESIKKEIQLILGMGNSFLMEVAVNEAVNNSLNANQSKKPITLSIRVTPNQRRLIIRIKDQGQGFKAQEALKEISHSPNLVLEDRMYYESGRGLSIMASAADKVIYNRKGTEVLLMKHIQPIFQSNMHSVYNSEVFR